MRNKSILLCMRDMDEDLMDYKRGGQKVAELWRISVLALIAMVPRHLTGLRNPLSDFQLRLLGFKRNTGRLYSTDDTASMDDRLYSL